MANQEVVVVMVPLPAQGHLNQLLHLSRLISAHDITVYYIGTTTHNRQAKLRLQGWDPSTIINLHFHDFPTTSFDNPSPDPNNLIKFPSQLIPSLNETKNLREPVYDFVNELSTRTKRVVVIHDVLMSYVVQDIDSVLHAEVYSFRSISAITSFHWEVAKNVDLLHTFGREFFEEIVSSYNYVPPEFAKFMDMQRGARNISCGDIFNTNREIEGLYLDLLAKGKKNKIWALGPFNPINTSRLNNTHKSLDFLDKQERNSVLLVSFGTASSLPDKQIQEIAHGLERSEQKFIWVLRDADKGDIFTGEVREAELPEGFEERVKQRGIVVRDWAPQLEILSHSSIGGFMSHCGWNSCMESISLGVPLATWPMHSDQPGNAVLITKVLKIGVQVKNWSSEEDDPLVLSSTIELAIRKLMASTEGNEIRQRAVELGHAVKNSASEGGNASNEMDSFISQITR